MPGKGCQNLALATLSMAFVGGHSDTRHMGPGPRARILLVEDDSVLAAGLVRGLRRAGFEVELVTDGVQGTERACSDEFELVILDLMLPERDGFEVLRQVRARSMVPVIVVTARTDLPDRLRAFSLGAVDYLPKPFFVEELLARIHARLALLPTTEAHRIIEEAGARIDLAAHSLEVDGQPVRLTPTEFSILRYLVEREGRAVSRVDLCEALRGAEEADPAHIEAHVSRLRRKLGASARLIVTVWGHGYRFDSRPPGVRS